jgi:hypothetical protein
MEKRTYLTMADRERLTAELLDNIKKQLPELEEFQAIFNKSFGYEDAVYRLYNQSYKVFGVQSGTVEIVAALQAMMPNRQLNEYFQEIVADGTGREFHPDDNLRWMEATRPIIEAFGHAFYFLGMAVKYGKELDEPPTALPSGWAALLCLFDLN